MADNFIQYNDTPRLETLINNNTDAIEWTRPLSVACVGTSITQQGTGLYTDANPRVYDLTYGHAGWLEHLSNHRIRLVRRNGVFESYTDKTFGYPGYNLLGLIQGANGVYPLDNAIVSGAEVLVMEGGTNDIANSIANETIISRITEYWTTAINAGKKVIALNILPVGSASGATKRDNITTINTAIISIAASLGVILIDTHAIATKDVNGYATIESLWDGVHPTAAYALRLAKLIDTQLYPFYVNRPQEMIVPSASTSALWLTPTNSPSGNVKPVSGDWYKSGTGTDTWTAITDADGTTWQRLKFTQTGAAASVNGFFILTSVALTAGDRIRGAIRIRAVDGEAFGCRDMITLLKSTNLYSTAAITGGNNMGTGVFTNFSGLFVTPILTVPAGMTNVSFNVQFYNDTSFAFDFRQCGVFKVVENL